MRHCSGEGVPPYTHQNCSDVTGANRLGGHRLTTDQLLTGARNPPSGGDRDGRTSRFSSEGYIEKQPSEARASIYNEVRSRSAERLGLKLASRSQNGDQVLNRRTHQRKTSILRWLQQPLPLASRTACHPHIQISCEASGYHPQGPYQTRQRGGIPRVYLRLCAGS